MKILIFGGAGFIGASLAALLSKHHEVTVVGQSTAQVSNPMCEYFVLEYNENELRQFLNQGTYDVIHILSANPHPMHSETYPLADISLTVIPTLIILEVLRQNSFKGNLWVASSVAVYGACKDQYLSENSECIPSSNYAVAKISIENYAKIYSQIYKLNIGVYRIFSTFGPRLKRQVVFDTIMKLRNHPSEIFLNCTNETARDFSFVEDQASAIKFLSENVLPKGDVFNVGSGVAVKIVNIVNLIAELMGYKGSIRLCESQLNQYDTSWAADISKIQSLGFSQNYSLREGLEETIRYVTK